MPNTINLLPISTERLQSDFPSLHNANIVQIRDAVNYLFELADQDQTTLSALSGSLADDIDTLRSDTLVTTNSLQGQIGQITINYATNTFVQDISSDLQTNIDAVDAKADAISAGLAGIIGNDLDIVQIHTDIDAISGHIDNYVFDLNTTITSVSGDVVTLGNDVQQIRDEYSTLSLVAEISGGLDTRMTQVEQELASVATSANIEKIRTDISSISGQVQTNTGDIVAISGQLLNRPTFSEVIDTINEIGGVALTGPTVTTSEIITEYNLTRAIDLSDDEVIILAGTPEEGDRAIFYDASDNAYTNSATISAGSFTYVLNDNSGAVQLEYRNSQWTAMHDLDTKFEYDENGDIVTDPETGIVAPKLRAGHFTKEYNFNLDSLYDDIETNVEQTSGYFTNTFAPEITPFNQGNYQTDEDDPFVITAISHDTSNYPWKAFDGDTGSGWVSDNLESDSITIDLGVANQKQFTGFRFFNGSVSADRPLDFAIQASNDHLVWQDLLVVDGDNTTTSQWSTLYNIFNFGNYRFYRMNIFDTNTGGKVRVNEIEFREGLQAQTDNAIVATVYEDTNPVGISPLTLQVYDENFTNIIGENKVQVAYAVNGNAFSSFYDLEDFRKLSSVEGVIKFEIKIKMVGVQKYTGFKIEQSSSFVESNSQEFRIVSDGNEVIKGKADGTIVAKSTEFGTQGEVFSKGTLDFYNAGSNINQNLSGWESVATSGANTFDVDIHTGDPTGFGQGSLEILDENNQEILDTSVSVQYNLNGAGFGTTSYTISEFKDLDPNIFVSCNTLSLRLILSSGTIVTKVNIKTTDNIIKVYPSGDFVLERGGDKAFEIRSDGRIFSDSGTFGIRGDLLVNTSLSDFDNPEANVDQGFESWGNVFSTGYATTNNTFTTTLHNGSATSFSNSSVVFRDEDGEVITTDTVNVDYALNGGAYQGSLLAQSAFKLLDPSIFEGITQLDIKLQAVGAQRIKSIEMNQADTLVELTDEGYLQVLDSGKPVVRVNKDGLFADVNGQWIPNTFTTVEAEVNGNGIVIDTIDETLGNSAEWSAFVSDGTNMVAFKIMVIWDGNGNVNFNEVRTPKIGNVSPLDFYVDESANQIRLIGDASSGTWNVRAKRTFI